MLCSFIAGGVALALALAEQRLRAAIEGQPIPWSLAVIGLNVGVPVLSSVVFVVMNAMRTAAWLRAVVLVTSIVGLGWLPSALIIGALPGGEGPVAALYQRLGDPQAGRWTAAGLGLVAWVVLSGVASRRAVAIGRAWMRVDAAEFRRRLVRVVAGWPLAAAVAVLAVGQGWARTPLILLWIAAAVAVLQLRTR